MQAATPTTEQVRTQRYPLARTLHLIGPRRSTDTASAFIDFCLSPTGQSLVRKAAYVSITQDGE